jgi:hypothetical protein
LWLDRSSKIRVEKVAMNDRGNWVSSPLTHLIDEVGRAAYSGWGQTIRLLVLLIAIGAVAALVLTASRYGVAAIVHR